MTRPVAGIVIALPLLLSGCAREHVREFELRGQVLSVDPARQEVTIRHEDIPQFMPGMTMAFKVATPGLLDGRRQSTVEIGDEPRLYNLLRLPRPREGLLELRFSPGLAAYAFTFG